MTRGLSGVGQGGCGHAAVEHLRVDHRRGDVGVAQKNLDSADGETDPQNKVNSGVLFQRLVVP
jgi:hypothetical protein